MAMRAAVRPGKVVEAAKEYGVADAAKLLGLTMNYVYKLIWTGGLTARKRQGQWQVTAASIARRLKAKEKAA